jgi:hypothetical protein
MDLLKIYRIYPDPGTKAVLLCRIIVQNARRFYPKIPKHLNDLPGIITDTENPDALLRQDSFPIHFFQ